MCAISRILFLFSGNIIYVYGFMSSMFLGKSIVSIERISDSFRMEATLLEKPVLVEESKLGGLNTGKLGIGTWSWGDSLYWQYSDSMDKELQDTFNTCVELGINFFDTAEIYGFGRSEYLCGKFKREFKGNEDTKNAIAIASKFAAVPLPNRLNRKGVVQACKSSLDRMGLKSMELYQLHWASFIRDKEYLAGLADCYDQGLVKAVGVSNYGPKLLQQAYDALSDRGIPLSTNQIQYSLLYRGPDKTGLLEKCEDLGVKVLAYSPLAQGLLTGKYTQENLPKGPRARVYKKILPKIEPLVAELKQIGQVHDKTPAQVSLNWCISKGTVPIPGAKNVAQATDNAGALGWELSPEEVKALDVAADKINLSLNGFSLQ